MADPTKVTGASGSVHACLTDPDLEVPPPPSSSVKTPLTQRPSDLPNSVCSYDGPAGGASQAVPADAAPPVTPQQLQAQLARQAAEQRLLGEAMNAVSAALGEVAHGGRMEPFLNVMWQRPDFLAALQSLPPDVVIAGLEKMVQAYRPDATPEQVRAITEGMAKHINLSLTTDASQRMRELVTTKLTDAAQAFEATAADSQQVEKLCARLAHLERPDATQAERTQATDLRAGLGLEREGEQVTPKALKPALEARARLMAQEATHMKERGENTLYRTLLTHDVRAEYLRAANLTPGSWAAQGVAGVKKRGEDDEADLAKTKLAASVALAAVSAGMGLGVLGSVGLSSAFEAPGVLNAYHHVDSAAAGGSAGTAAADAQAKAQAKAHAEAAHAAVAILSKKAVGKLIHHQVEGLTVGARIGVEAAKSAVVSQAVHGALPNPSAPAPATGTNAVDRALPR
jgi:hypothetical protein